MRQVNGMYVCEMKMGVGVEATAHTCTHIQTHTWSLGVGKEGMGSRGDGATERKALKKEGEREREVSDVACSHLQAACTAPPLHSGETAWSQPERDACLTKGRERVREGTGQGIQYDVLGRANVIYFFYLSWDFVRNDMG